MWAEMAVVGVKLAFVLAVMLTTVPIMVWVERRGSALIQDRLGPNRVGPFGLLQPVIDVVKLLTKENLRPEGAQTFFYLLAPAIAIAISLSTFIAVPFAQDSGLEVCLKIIRIRDVLKCARQHLFLAVPDDVTEPLVDPQKDPV